MNKGATTGILNMTPETLIFLDRKNCSYCIKKGCLGETVIKMKDIIGKTVNGSRWAISSHSVCFEELKEKKLYLK